MKDEIKEILDEFLHIICTQCNYQDEVKYSLTYKQMKVLLDCITNLQQIEQDHQKLNGELREENKKLQEEIERQSKAQVILDNQIANMQQNLWEEQEISELFKDKYEKMKENAEILSKGYSDLEKRNEKAIEYNKQKLEDIKEEIITVTIYDKKYEKYVKEILDNNLNILQGDDKE